MRRGDSNIMSMVLLLASCLIVGIFIGAVGVGGVLLIPALMSFSNLTVHQAAATALFSFLFTGVLGTWLFMRRGSIQWRTSMPVCIGAFAFSYIGAAAGMVVPAAVLTWIVAAVILGAGLNILRGRTAPHIDDAPRHPTAKALFGVGALSGFGAGISGAGGPLFSVPLMLGLHFDALVAVGTGQVVQIAAAVSGSLSNWSYGTIQYELAAPVTAVEVIGVVAGVKLAHVAGEKQLRYGAAVLCIVSAVGMVAKSIASR
jgi:uncharacterized membrane protein YfcA